MASSKDITTLLQEWQAGDSTAPDELFELVYKELRRIAQKRLSGENRNPTLQATELVHEVFPQLARQRQPWQNRSQFYALASECMRRFLVDHARTRRRQKRGGDQFRVPISDLKGSEVCRIENFEEILAVDRALEKLSELDATKALIIKHRYFGGLARDEIADLLEVSPATVDRAYRSAKAWLRRELAFQFSPYLLHVGQISKPNEFIEQFRHNSNNRLARQLASALPNELIAQINTANPDITELLPATIEAINKLLLGTLIFPPEIVRQMIGETPANLTIEETIRLNRRLFEAAFPNQVVSVLK